MPSSHDSVSLETSTFSSRTAELVGATVAARKLLGSHVTDYLHSRGLTEETIIRWNIGYWHPGLSSTKYVDHEDLRAAGMSERLNETITFPLSDLSGVTRGLVGRVLPGDQRPVKYLYPDKSPYLDRRSHLFGANHYLRYFHSSRTVILVEGVLDAILLQQSGCPGLCSHSATFTLEQALLLRALADHLILFPDGDDTGRRMVDRAKQYRSSLPDDIKVVSTPTGEDPASLITQLPDLIESATHFV